MAVLHYFLYKHYHNPTVTLAIKHGDCGNKMDKGDSTTTNAEMDTNFSPVWGNNNVTKQNGND